MIRSVFVLLVFFGLLSSSFQVQAGETLTVAAKEIRGMIDSPDSGAFVQILRAIEKVSDLRFNILVLPPARAVHVFETGGADILLPHPHKASAIARSFYTRRNFIFHQCGASLSQYADLKDKSVALTRGYQYNHEKVLEYAREIVIVSSDEIAMRMLNQRRVDAVIGEEVSLRMVIRDEGLSAVCYDEDAVVESSGVFMLFSHKKPLQKVEKLVNSLLDRVSR